ncbi:DUF3159 domain-containing protein [Nocardioides rotundus]|uniref:DUF3159 domain-containing protein n=1 Tax=Nocardioides rotundus TaxID=1774216 RepID=UPI001CC150DC|nr:DUF3159 domain-containing protein [Nocardioides rotundus]UAL28278.1 DUF3159 domain-containing protein [Nocardioides rotundus]
MSDTPPPATVETVEQVVRGQLARALGGRRGMLEAGVPALLFTIVWFATRDLRLALVVSIALAAVLLGVRVVQRSTPQFALNALFGIGIGWLFVWMAARGGGDANDQALAFFLPGILVSSVMSVLLALSCLTRWPAVGFMLGSVTGDPTAWREDPQIVTLCTRLTWAMAMPSIVGVALQGPVWLMGHFEAIDPARAVLLLGTLRYGLGWPLKLGAAALMTWLLARNHTPVADPRSVHRAVDVRQPPPAS